MNTHEYQAKEILADFGVPMPPFRVASNMDEARKAIDELGITTGVVKIQVHAGGRGKAGGVKLGKTKDELLKHCQALIGMKMVNNQTGPEGVIAHKVMIAPDVNIKKEYYVGAIIDRERARATMIVSPEGGMDIEEVAAKTPERIMTVPIRFDGFLYPYQLRNIAQFMGWQGTAVKSGMKVVAALARAFIASDASLLEINPLVEDGSGAILALDAKLSIDDNALFRQKRIADFYDATQVNPYEAEATKHDLAYIALDGNIGCMVNGAGLAMATMDIIQHYGGTPANFLDVGGSATEEKVAEGFKVILSDHKVKGILVNIFGGIMNCATIARGVIQAAQSIGIKVPLVVRLEGTNVEEGRRLLEESGLNLITATSLAEGAEKVVASIQ
ncbi:MAG: ADP-forming succinate--CoA ligase subunit beta [Chlamydiia bacterium]|nr:ADP-forming succinate--CoA ligase subunit beta [Chlamydiia bacterium]